MGAATIPLVPAQISAVLQAATVQALQFAGASIDSNVGVIIDWASQGQPFQDITQDVFYLGVTQVNDPFTIARDITILEDTGDETSVFQQQNYTRCWRCHWCVYGPNSTDRTRLLYEALMTQQIHDLLAVDNLYMIAELPTPQRIVEEINGQWWERVDFNAEFYEYVTNKAFPVGAVAGVEVIINTPTAPSAPGQPPAEMFWVPPSAQPFTAPVISGTQITAQGPSITTLGAALTVVVPVIAVQAPGGGLIQGPNLGSIFISLQLASGNFQSGGPVAPGGPVSYSIPGVPNLPAGYNGVLLTGGNWTLITQADGTHYYLLTLLFTGSQGSGTIVIITSNIGHNLWAGSANVSNGSMQFN